MEVPPNFIIWIMKYLTSRSQFVYLRSSNARSSLLDSNTGAPQGTVLAPFLFTAYTADVRANDNSCILVKFADDTALVGLISNDDSMAYVTQVQEFVSYCEENYLELNVMKTKELIIDFRKCRPSLEPIMINNSEVQRTSKYKYLGVVMDDCLSWHDHIDHLCKKLNPRLYCLRKMSKFKVDQNVMQLFYQAVISSVWKYCLSSWGGNARKYDTSRIDRTIKQAGRIISECQTSFETSYNDEVWKKLKRIQDNVDHPLNELFTAAIIQRSGRMRLPPAVTNRHRLSFVPQAITLYNKNFKR
jgi:hypothetical protein